MHAVLSVHVPIAVLGNIGIRNVAGWASLAVSTALILTIVVASLRLGARSLT